jgi:hypothetical protein
VVGGLTCGGSAISFSGRWLLVKMLSISDSKMTVEKIAQSNDRSKMETEMFGFYAALICGLKKGISAP